MAIVHPLTLTLRLHPDDYTVLMHTIGEFAQEEFGQAITTEQGVIAAIEALSNYTERLKKLKRMQKMQQRKVTA